MESSAAGKCIPHKSKKRVFPYTESKGDGSSSPVNRSKNKMHKQNQDTMVSIRWGTSSAISKEVKSYNKGKSLGGVIELDTEDSDYCNGKDYIDLSSDDNDDECEYPTLESHFDDIDLPTGMESSNPGFLDSVKMTSSRTSSKRKGVKTYFDSAKVTKRIAGSSSSTCPSLRLKKGAMKVKSFKKLAKTRSHKMSSGSGEITPMEDVMLEQDSRKIEKSSNVAGTSFDMEQHENNDVSRKYPDFKKFDIVEDYSDHHYKWASSETMQPPKNWSKKIQKEWRILEKDLPDTIFVRVYESRMDLLRAVIIGAEGTPYHDGFFFL